MAGWLAANGQVFYAAVCVGVAMFLASDLSSLYVRSAGRDARRKAFIDSSIWRDSLESSPSAHGGTVSVVVPAEHYFRAAFNEVPVEAGGVHVSPEGLGFDLFGEATAWSEGVSVNPATGLPMSNGVDVAGNVFGSDSMSSVEGYAGNTDSFSSSDGLK